MLERFLDQIGEVLRLCEDTDGILVVNREGIIEYHRIPLNSYWCSQDTVGRHILELYPELDGESSTILTALRTGRASYNVLQDINNHRGERVLLESPGEDYGDCRLEGGGRPGGVRGGLVQVPHH